MTTLSRGGRALGLRADEKTIATSSTQRTVVWVELTTPLAIHASFLKNQVANSNESRLSHCISGNMLPSIGSIDGRIVPQRMCLS